MFFQYPNLLHRVDTLYKLVVKRKSLIQVLIHDLDSLRYVGKEENLELFCNADVLIAHTDIMKQYLQNKYNLKNKIQVLHLFDYFVDNDCCYSSNLGNTLIYAGNLSGNTFLKEINMKTYVYGNAQDWLHLASLLDYQGEFDPNDLSSLKGDWGLLWYGGNIHNFGEDLKGRYFTINASHKVSLYLAAGKPIVTWRNTAMGRFIEKENLGLVVDSLYNLEDKIKTLTISEKEAIKANVMRYSQRIRKGEMLSSILRNL